MSILGVKGRTALKGLSHAQYGEMVEQARQGDMEAFAVLYAATVEGQLYFATAFLKDEALAEDAIQEVYISLFKNLENIHNGTLFIAYLRKITYNTCVDFRKRQMKERFEFNEELLDLQPDTDDQTSPHDWYERMDRADSLYAAIEELPDEYRAAFLMRYYLEMKISQIASAMELSESTVKRYIKRATSALRKKL